MDQNLNFKVYKRQPYNTLVVIKKVTKANTGWKKGKTIKHFELVAV